MVCKENVVSWFGNLSSNKRIDVMCTLLKMCLPFEIRYIGTCIEDIGKRDYNELRDSEHRANSANELAERTALGISDQKTRRTLALYVALLHSCNYSCAGIIHKILTNLDSQDITNIVANSSGTPDDQPLEELLLIYTMAINHPAFTYEQKTNLGNIYLKLQDEEARLNLPKPVAPLPSWRSAQGPSDNPLDRTIESTSEIANCSMPPPPLPYHGEMSMRGNAMVSGVPPGLTMPPPGLCMPGPEQMTMGSTTGAQYLAFQSVNPIGPWSGQVMMGNHQLMYHTGEMLAYPSSPLVSRQSSPSQSRSPSRSNSPLRRNNPMSRTSSQVTPSTPSTLTTSLSGANTQTCNTSTNVTGHSTRSLPSGPPPLLPPRTIPTSCATSSMSYSRCNSTENNSTIIASKQPPPPPRLRPVVTLAGDPTREPATKEIPNISDLGRMSDEDLRDIGMSPNAVGQLRSIVPRSQPTNGLGQPATDKKLDGGTSNASLPVVDQTDNEEQNQQQQQLPQQLPPQAQQQSMHHSHNSHVGGNRRYPMVPPIDATSMQMYPPPPLYAAPNQLCYGACLPMQIGAIQNRYAGCNNQHIYCTNQLRALHLDPESGRHCSHSSSSESTGSRSPPETPPAVPWVGPETSAVAPTTEAPGSSHHSTGSHSSVPPQYMSERPRNQSKKHHGMRHKNHMINGARDGNGSCGPPNLPHAASFAGPPTSSHVAYLPHGHFTGLRPTSGIYSNFAPAYGRPPTYQATYQPNGEMLYQYPGHPGPGGTPPPPPAVVPPHSYMQTAPVVTYTPAATSAKISCYNCGSSTHLAVDCKDQTMEGLTKRATYRLDYTQMKQPGECPGTDK